VTSLPFTSPSPNIWKFSCRLIKYVHSFRSVQVKPAHLGAAQRKLNRVERQLAQAPWPKTSRIASTESSHPHWNFSWRVSTRTRTRQCRLGQHIWVRLKASRNEKHGATAGAGFLLSPRHSESLPSLPPSRGSLGISAVASCRLALVQVSAGMASTFVCGSKKAERSVRSNCQHRRLSCEIVCLIPSSGKTPTSAI